MIILIYAVRKSDKTQAHFLQKLSKKITKIEGLIIYCMYLLEWAMLSRYFIKYFSRCFFEDVSLKSMHACSVCQSCLTLCKPMDVAHQASLFMGFFPSKNTGVGCYFLLQGIFPTQRSKPAPPELAGRFFMTEPRVTLNPI